MYPAGAKDKPCIRQEPRIRAGHCYTDNIQVSMRRVILFTLSRLKAQAGFVLSPKALNVFVILTSKRSFV